MGGLIGLVILVLDIIAIIDLFKSAKDTGKKVLWLIIIIVLPIIGMLLYFFMGKKK